MANAAMASQKWAVVTSYVETLLELIEDLGLSRQELLKAVNVNPEQLADQEFRLPVSTLLDMFTVIAEKTGALDIGLRMGVTIKPKSYGLLGYVLMFSRTIREGIKSTMGYGRIAFDVGEIVIIDHGDTTEIALHPHCEEFVQSSFLIDAKLAGWISISKMVSVEYHAPIKVCLTYAEPDNTELIQKVFGDNVHYCAEQNSIHFATQWLDQPFVHADKLMLERLLGEAQQLLDSLGSDQTIAVLVKKDIATLLGQGSANAENIANRMQMTRRTLQRRLSAEGAQFQDLLQEVRHKMALSHLRNMDLSILEIALLLGYTDHSSFTKAFKSWHTISPLEFRKNRSGASIS